MLEIHAIDNADRPGGDEGFARRSREWSRAGHRRVPAWAVARCMQQEEQQR
jgi:hypothetical protein